jgi:hypothetical protein
MSAEMFGGRRSRRPSLSGSLQRPGGKFEAVVWKGISWRTAANLEKNP